jgi:hypothetical protein
MPGLVNATLLLLLASFPVLIHINKTHLKGKNKKFNQLLKMLRKVHPIGGIILVLSGIVHGYLKLGKFAFHTGSLIIIALLLGGIVGFMYKKTKKRQYALLHRVIGITSILALALHYLNPWLFS